MMQLKPVAQKLSPRFEAAHVNTWMSHFLSLSHIRRLLEHFVEHTSPL
jgi:hypothetical protein